jgi:hypothetical protein
MENINIWLNEIVKALNDLRGQGSLIEIYNKIEEHNNIDFSKYQDWKSQVRKNIYLHSSDCDIFKGVPGDQKDIFCSINGKGNGLWGIRKKEIDFDNEINKIIEILESHIINKNQFVQETNEKILELYKKGDVVQLKQLYNKTLPVNNFYKACEEKLADFRGYLNANRN